jgi:hypothetical protein
MKKLLRNSLAVFILFIFVFSFNAIAQIRIPSPADDPVSGQIYIEGWVCYENNDNTDKKNGLEIELTIRLKEGSLYMIEGVTLNGKLISDRGIVSHYRRLYKCLTPFDCQVGQKLEIKVGLIDTTQVNQIAIYKTVAKIIIKNLFKSYKFPAPNQVIDLASYDEFLPFKWRFTNFFEKSLLRIYERDGSVRVLEEEITGDRYNVSKKALKPATKYKIWHITLDQHKFSLTSEASSDSELKFSHVYTLYFKTK